MSHVRTKRPVALSIGIIACNEESSIPSTLGSLFHQSQFGRIAERHAKGEYIVVANACTDRTATGVPEPFARMEREHEWAGAWRAHVMARSGGSE